MRHCAFLTMAEPEGYVIDDEHAYEPLRALGWQVEAVPWNRPGVAWGDYELVVIRSTWDYHHDPQAFLAVLAEIARRVRLENRLDLVHWNLRKTYLRDLAARGVPIVPTVWRDRLGAGDLERLLETVPGEEAVLKPVVGANAEGAFRLDRRNASERAAEVEEYFSDRALMAQPFARAVLEEGEYSLFYFGGEHSHTILKTPRPEDFRVQEEHGGIIRAVRAGAALRAAGAAALAAVGDAPLYLRADFVRSGGGGAFWLLEPELIERSLDLRMDPEAPARFARALDARMTTAKAAGPAPSTRRGGQT